jgi:hypothetical protein
MIKGSGGNQKPNGIESLEALEETKFIHDFKAFSELDRIIETCDVYQT